MNAEIEVEILQHLSAFRLADIAQHAADDGLAEMALQIMIERIFQHRMKAVEADVGDEVDSVEKGDWFDDEDGAYC